ncbi:MAG: hypothetical protein ACKO13_15000, partial [Cytophagales bacterium]
MKVKGLTFEFKSNQLPFLNFIPQILLFIIFALWSIISNAQSGNYFLSNFTPTTNNVDHVSFGIAQSDKGVLYFATKNGVIEFDGKNWSLIPTSGAVFTVFSYENEILLGGVKGIGKLSWDQGKHHVYKSISEKHPEAINIFALFINIELFGLCDEHHCKVCIYLPVPVFVCRGECTMGNG